MVTLAALWLPIVLSAVAVFFVSFLVWTVLPWHKRDFAELPDEGAARRALEGVPRGQYNVPHLSSRAELGEPEAQRKFEEGPVAFLVVLDNALPNLPKSLVQWFVFNLAVGVMAAYVAGRALDAGAALPTVLRFTCTVSWLAYGWAYVQEAVWFGRPWRHVVKQLVDGLIYGLVTGAIFGWLWPS